MSKPTRRLGRGLDALVPTLKEQIVTVSAPTPLIAPAAVPAPPPIKVPAPAAEPSKAEEVKGISFLVPTGELRPNRLQPRKDFGESSLLELSDSIKRSGVIQPIAVRRFDGGYEIIAGERRWRAAKMAGVSEVPVIIRQASDEQMLELALVENLQREDLNPIDRAMAYRQYCDRFDIRPEEVAKRVSEDRTTVVNYMRLLDLPAEIRQWVADGLISMGHARSLVGVADPKRQLDLATRTMKGELSVRELEKLVRAEKDATANSPGKLKAISPHVRDIQRKFEDALKTRVSIVEGKKKGSGRMIIEYFSIDDFDRLARLLGICLD